MEENIIFIKDSLAKNDEQHKEILTRIDHLGVTFQGKIQDKADQKEVMVRFDKLDETYVSQETFRPIQKLIYGMVGAILLAFIGAVVALVLKI